MKTWIKGIVLGLAMASSAAVAGDIDKTCGATCGRRMLDSLNTIINPIRVNQVGYRTDDPHKEAFVAGLSAAAPFSIIDGSGKSVYSGTLKDVGTYPYKGRILIKGYYNSTIQLYKFSNTNDTDSAAAAGTTNERIWRAAFGDFVQEGSGYRIVVGKDTSEPFDIRMTIYNDVFETSLKFFGWQRSGNTDSWAHGPSHMKDGSAIEHDLTGGWYDCGDYFKVGQTDAYAFTNLILAYTLWPQKAEDRYGSSYNDTLPFGNDGIPDLLREAKIGADYVMKLYRASVADNLLAKNDMYMEVGVWGNDHQYWDLPENADAAPVSKGGPPRPVDKAAGSAVPAQYAGSLAMFAKAWRPFDPDYADSCLQAAKSIYKNVVLPNWKISGYSNASFYTEQGRFDDDLAWAATGLWYATGDTSYKYDLMGNKTYGDIPGAIANASQLEFFPAGFMAKYGGLFSPGGWPMDYQNTFIQTSWALWDLFYKSDTLASKWGIPASDAQLVRKRLLKLVGDRYASESTNGNAVYPGTNVNYLKPYGLVWSSITWGMNRYNMGSVLPIVAYHEMIKGDSSQAAQAYWNIILDNMNYNLGKNPWDISFVMGAGSKNLQHPHNRIANPEGYNAGGIPYPYRSPKGALMGGAIPGNLLRDEWEKYDVTETCIDFSAQMVIPSQYLAQDLPPDTTGPIFKNVTVVKVSDTSALISWQTDELSRDTLFYSIIPNGPIVGKIVSPLSKNKTATVTGLKPNTTYYFWFKGTDIYNNVSLDNNRTRDYTFTTTTTAAVNPKIYDVKACNIRSNKATVFWWTDIIATSQVVYHAQDSTTLHTVSTDDEGLPGRFHKVTLTGLQPNTTYRYKVVSDGAEDDSSGGYSFTTTQDFANYAVQIKATTKNSNGAGAFYYLWVANKENKSYDGLEVRFYFQATDAVAKSIVVHGVDNAMIDITGSPASTPVDFIYGSAQPVTGMSGYWYIPITIKGIFPVAGRAKISLQMDNSNWQALPWSVFANAWSTAPHTSPVAFAGIDTTWLWKSDQPVEKDRNGQNVATFIDDAYIGGYYKGVHIFGYTPDGTKPRVFRSTSFNFDKPLVSPATSVWQDTFAVKFLGETWSAPDVVKADWQVDGPTLRSSTPLAAGRTDSVQFVHDSADPEGTTAHEFAFWGDRDSSYCSCAWQRYIVTVDTMKVPPRQLKLVWSSSDTFVATTGSRQSLVLSLLDSNGKVLDTTATVSLLGSTSKLLFWSVASQGAPVTSVVLSHGTATVWFSDSTADTLPMTASVIIPGSVVAPATTVLAFSTVPPRKLTLSWEPVGPITAWSGTHRTSAIVTLSDSAGVFDTSATVMLSASATNVRFWNAASGATRLASLVLVHGKATVWFSDSLADTVTLTSLSAIPGSAVAPGLLSVAFQTPPPWPLIDSAWTVDSSCSGSPTAVTVRLSSKLSVTTTLTAAAAELSATQVIFAGDSIHVLADSQTVLLGLPVGTVSGTSVSGAVRIQLHVKDDTRDTLVWDTASVLDRIGPVLLKASVLELADGQTQDTVYLKFSEAVKVSDAPVVFPSLASVKESAWNAMDTTNAIWRVVIDPQGAVAVGTAAKASVAVVDFSGNAARECSQAVPMVQQWRPVPIASAAIYSLNSDGRADSVVVRFRRKMRIQDTIVGLSATFGVGTYKSTDSAMTWTVASDSTSMTGRFAFAWGATSGDGEDRTGTVYLYTQGAMFPEMAPLADSVGPVLLSAALNYSKTDGVADTLWLGFSEDVRLASAVVSPNREHSVLDGNVLSVSGAKVGFLIFADSLRLGINDSLRAAPQSLGGVTDAGLVANETSWKLAPIHFGKRPPVFLIMQRNSVVNFGNWNYGAETPMRVLIHSATDTTWGALSGTNGTDVNPSRILGVALTANECFDGFVVIYDNLGTYVASMELSDLYKACQEKTLPVNSSGRYQVWLTWDGRSISREVASTGVYTLRLVTRRPNTAGTGLERVTNQLFRFGWKRKP